MKIAIIAPRFPPQGDFGGVEMATQDISHHLAQRGHDVFVITSGKKIAVEKLSERLAICRVLDPNIPFWGGLLFWGNIFFALRKIKPDIVHCQTIQMGLPAFLFKKIYQKPYLVWCHGFDVYFPWKGKKMISRLVLRSANKVVALTGHMQDELEKTSPQNVVILPNGIDVKTFQGFSKQIIRDRLGISGEEKIILFVGALKAVKGVEYLIEAFKVVRPKIPMAKLFLVGDDTERPKLESIVTQSDLQKSVHFVGRVLHEKIPPYMAAADILVLPSLSEGFPVVLLEAMASGLPIIATNVRGLPEIIKDGENGFLVEPKNSAQLAAKIQVLLEDVTLCQEISIANQKKAREYDWGNVVGKIEKMYSGLIKKL